MNTYSVVEIFQSIQGEGLHTGSPSNFIRLAGCPLECEFCDTDYEARKDLTVEEILQKLNPDIRTVILTGGEPLIHNFNPLIIALRRATYRIHLETSGILPLPSGIDYVSVSPKKGYPVKYDLADEVKWLVPLWSFEEINWSLSRLHFLQPINGKFAISKKNLRKCIWMLLNCKPPAGHELRLSVQLHKWLEVR